MSLIDMVLLYWVVPSLVTLLLMLNLERKYYNTPLEDFKFSDWLMTGIVSVAYPAGIIIVFILQAWPLLIKER